MKFYKKQRKYYCGIDLHARKMYVCIIDSKAKVKVLKNIKAGPEIFLDLIFPSLDDIVVGVECVFCWYWLWPQSLLHQRGRKLALTNNMCPEA